MIQWDKQIMHYHQSCNITNILKQNGLRLNSRQYEAHNVRNQN